MYQLLESFYDNVKALWEERFEIPYRRWRGFVDGVVAHYLDCGVAEADFARLKCARCGSERLLTLSCKQRGVCPSCDAKRAAAFAAFLKDELLEEVGHSLWTFTMPKMLRPYFNHRELLRDLARLGYETVKELMIEAVGDEQAGPGVVAVPQTFGSILNPHPHLHCLASRGVWNAQGQWLPVPYTDTAAAEQLFRHKVFQLLKGKGLLSDERIELLTSFRPSGFSVDDSVTVWPQDAQGLERLARYLLRCPVSLSRIHWTPGSNTLFYEGKNSHEDPFGSHPQGETLDIFEFIARVLTQIPQPQKHGLHYFGAYSARARTHRNQAKLTLQAPTDRDASQPPAEPRLSPPQRAALLEKPKSRLPRPSRVHTSSRLAIALDSIRSPGHCTCAFTATEDFSRSLPALPLLPCLPRIGRATLLIGRRSYFAAVEVDNPDRHTPQNRGERLMIFPTDPRGDGASPRMKYKK